MRVVAETRTEQGSSASRRLRRAGKVPGIIYGGRGQPTRIALEHNPLYHSMRVEAFQSSILDLELDGRRERVLLRDVQWHAFKPQVLHVDFLRVSADQEITVSVPFHFENADVAPAVKRQGAVINHVMNEIEVTCLPDKLPEFVVIDLAELTIEKAIHLSELKFPEGVTPVVAHGAGDPVVVNAAIIEAEKEPVGGEAGAAADSEAAGGDEGKKD